MGAVAVWKGEVMGHNYWFGCSEHPAHYFQDGESLVDCALCGEHEPHPIHIQTWKMALAYIEEGRMRYREERFLDSRLARWYALCLMKLRDCAYYYFPNRRQSDAADITQLQFTSNIRITSVLLKSNIRVTMAF